MVGGCVGNGFEGVSEGGLMAFGLSGSGSFELILDSNILTAYSHFGTIPELGCETSWDTSTSDSSKDFAGFCVAEAADDHNSLVSVIGGHIVGDSCILTDDG